MKDDVLRDHLFISAHNGRPAPNGSSWRPVRAEIDMAKIPADDNVGGLIFAIATVVIFLIGIPAIRVLFPMALLAGCAVAVILHFFRRGPRESAALHF